MAGGCRSAVGEGLLQPFVTGDGKNRWGGGDVRAGVPHGGMGWWWGTLWHGWECCWRTRRLCVIWNGYGGDGKGGGEHKSPQQQGALGCARPFSKQNTAGRGVLGLHILA